MIATTTVDAYTLDALRSLAISAYVIVGCWPRFYVVLEEQVEEIPLLDTRRAVHSQPTCLREQVTHAEFTEFAHTCRVRLRAAPCRAAPCRQCWRQRTAAGGRLGRRRRIHRRRWIRWRSRRWRSGGIVPSRSHLTARRRREQRGDRDPDPEDERGGDRQNRQPRAGALASDEGALESHRMPQVAHALHCARAVPQRRRAAIERPKKGPQKVPSVAALWLSVASRKLVAVWRSPLIATEPAAAAVAASGGCSSSSSSGVLRADEGCMRRKRAPLVLAGC